MKVTIIEDRSELPDVLATMQDEDLVINFIGTGDVAVAYNNIITGIEDVIKEEGE